MKTIKVSQLIYSILKDTDEIVEIPAIRVNRLCSNMRNQNIYCKLGQMDFEELMLAFPQYIDMDNFKVRVTPDSEFTMAIQNKFRFDSELVNNKDLLKYWEDTSE